MLVEIRVDSRANEPDESEKFLDPLLILTFSCEHHFNTLVSGHF